MLASFPLSLSTEQCVFFGQRPDKDRHRTLHSTVNMRVGCCELFASSFKAIAFVLSSGSFVFAFLSSQ